MAVYATPEDVQARMPRILTSEELELCKAWLEDAGALIDSKGKKASTEAKKTVSCRMVIRAIGDGAISGIPVGATQGSMSALGYSQSWTIGSGSSGELYLNKTDRQLLGIGDAVGCSNPFAALT